MCQFSKICTLSDTKANLIHIGSLFASMVVAILLLLGVVKPVLAASDVSITLTSQEKLWVDANKCNAQGPRGAWLSFVVANTGTTALTNVTVTFVGFTGTNASYFVTPSDLVRTFSSLAIGESIPVYYYVDYAEVCNHSQGGGNPYGGYTANYTLTVTSAELPLGVVRNGTIETDELITANAAGIAESSVIGPGIFVGQILTQTVSYSFGNNNDIFFQPAGDAGFKDECIRLVGSEITAVSGGVSSSLIGLKDRLHFPTASVPGGGGQISVTYSWEILCTNTSQIANPWAAAKSGQEYKYTGFGATATFPPAQQPLTVIKSVSPTSLPDNTGGPVTYTITFTNSSPVVIRLNSITDQLPACMSVANATATGSDVTAANSSSIPASGAVGTLQWIGKTLANSANSTYRINANSTLKLVYTADISNCPVPSTQTNSVTGQVGSTTVGPATATFSLGTPPSITVTKSNDANHDDTYSDTETIPSDVTYPYVVTYQLTIVNNTNIAATLTSISDDKTNVMLATSNESPTCASLVNSVIGANATLTCYYDVTFADANTAQVINIATVVATNLSGTDTKTDSATVNLTAQNRSLAILKIATPTTYDAVNDVISYSYLVTNTGNVTLPGPFTISDDKSSDESCPAIASLAPGASITCTASYTISQVDLDAGSVTNVASSSNGTTTSPTDSETVNAVQLPALAIDKRGTAGPVTIGDRVDYTITITNTGNVTLHDVTLTDAKLGLSEALGTLIVNQSKVVTGTYGPVTEADLPGPIFNTASVVGKSPLNLPVGPVIDTHSVPITVNQAIAIDKSADQILIEPGTLVTYFYTVTNPGQTTLNVTSISDDKCSPMLPTLSGADNVGDANTNGKLDVGEEWQYSCQTPLIADTLNTVVVTGTTQLGVDLTDRATANVDVRPTIAVTKTANPISIAESGGTVTYEYIVQNTSAEAVVIASLVDDRIPSNFDGDADCQLGTTLAVGESCSFFVSVYLSGDAPNTYTNIFFARAEDNENNEVTDSDDATVTFTDVKPTLIVTKTATPSSVPESGGLVTFDYQISNSSTETVTITSLSDDKFGTLLGDADCKVGIVLAPGEVCSFSVNQTLAGNTTATHVNIFTATGVDDEQNSTTDSDSATVTFSDVEPTLVVTKTASPLSVPETGGSVTFHYEVSNSSAESITITLLTDDKFGTLVGDADCKVGTLLVPGDSCSFDLIKTIAGDAPNAHVNTFTATAKDDENNSVSADDDASVTFSNVDPVVGLTKSVTPVSLAEPGGLFTYTLTIENSGLETTTIASLVDDYPLSDQCDALVNQELAPGAQRSCQYTMTWTVPGVYTNTATVVVNDDENNSATDSDSAEATVTNVGSSIKVTKNVTPTTVSEAGATVAYNIVVENTSLVDSVQIHLVDDDIFGDISGSCTPDPGLTSVWLPPGGTMLCSVTKFIIGNAGDSHINVATATGVDDDGEPVTDSDDAVVTFTDVPSAIEVTKVANPTSVNEPGGSVNYTVTVKNTSPTDVVTLTEVLDDKFGDVSLSCLPSLLVTLQPNETATCSFVGQVTGNAGATHTNTVTVSGIDDDGSTVSGHDSADVRINNVNSSLNVIKNASPTNLDEPGGNVTFSVEVRNTSAVDVITVTQVTDDIFGNVSSDCTVTLPYLLQPGAFFNCSFTRSVTGNSGFVHTDIITATGTDDDNQSVSANDDATVTIGGIASSVEVVKLANPTSVNEPGGDVNYTVYITNTSAVDVVTINGVDDNRFGQITNCSPAVGSALNPGEGMICTFTGSVIGQPGDEHVNVVTVATVDDDNNEKNYSDDAIVTFNNLASSIEVIKSAQPSVIPEPGGLVTYTVFVTNTSAVDDVTIENVDDDKFGDVSDSCVPALPQTLAPGEGLSCVFTRAVSGQANAVHTNTVTVTGTDDDDQAVSGGDSADVKISNVGSTIQVSKIATPSSLSEPGGMVNYQVIVENTSPVDVITITTVLDDKFGNIGIVGSACSPALPAVLAPNGSLVCSFARTISGNAGFTHTNTITVTGVDDDKDPVGGDDSAIVTITDLASSIEVSKQASPTVVDELGSDVTYTVTVHNSSAADKITINSVIDDKFGDIGDDCTPGLPATISPGSTITCVFTRFISGQAGGSHTNVVSAFGKDDDGNSVSDSANATVTIADVASAIAVTKTATPLSVSELGGTVTYTVQVRNVSPTDVVTITTVSDDKFGDVSASCTPKLPVVLEPGGTINCSFARPINGNAGGTHTNLITVTGTDDDGKPVEGEDDASVSITDVPASISVTKSANPLKIDAPGAMVTYTVQVRNDSAVDVVTIKTVVDNKFGDISGSCTPKLPVDLNPGQTLTCTFARFVNGVGNSSHVNIVDVTGVDDDGKPVSDSDDAEVLINEVVETPPPNLGVAKSTPLTSTLPNGTINYTIVYSNASGGDAVDVVIVETVPQYTTFNAALSTPGWQCALDSASNRTKCRFQVGNLAVGQAGSVVFAVTLVKDIPEIAGLMIVNLVTISSTNSPNDPADSDIVMTPVIFPTALGDSDEPTAPGTRRVFLPLVTR